MKTVKTKFVLLVVLTLFYLLSCSTYSQDLPKKRPADVQISYNEDGGMMLASKNYFISEDSSYYSDQMFDASNKVYFDVVSQELDELYAVFYNNNFGNISTYEEQVYDRGGNSVSIKWNGEEMIVSNSGFSFVNDDCSEQYGAVINAIQELVDSKVSEMKRDFVIKLDEGIKSSGKTVNILLDNSLLYSSDNISEKDSIICRLLNGNHTVKVNIYDKGNISDGKSIDGDLWVIEVSKDRKDMIIYLDGEDIKWR